MNVKNCRKCGSLFNYVMGPYICPACKSRLEEDFQRVKEYVRANPGATIHRVSEECEVTTGQINQWLREERLELTEGSAITLFCESCGAPINSGKYCDKCKKELTFGLREASRSAAPKVEQPTSDSRHEKGRMRFL